MKAALLGLMQSGKSTIFSAISGKAIPPMGATAIEEAIVPVPDGRLDWLEGLYKPKKKTYATIDVLDLPGGGTSNLLDQPEFSADPERIKGLMRALDRKKTLIDLLGRVLDDGGLQVIIGDEHPETGLARCSLVAAPYGAGGRVMGTLGIVGPTRMEYAQAVALVEYLAQVLSGYFSRPGD